MQYYKISISWDPKTKGIKDGSHQVERINEAVKDKGTMQRVNNFFSPLTFFDKKNYVPDFDIKLEGFRLRKGAKQTDFLDYIPTITGCPFMVNKKVSDLFGQFNLPKHYYYPVEIMNEGELINSYQLFYIPFIDVSVIDFPKSKFSSGYEVSKNLKIHIFESFEDMQNKRESSLTPQEIVLGGKFDTKLDLFNIRVGGLMVSERLKNAIQQTNLLGATIRDKDQYPIVSTA